MLPQLTRIGREDIGLAVAAVVAAVAGSALVTEREWDAALANARRVLDASRTHYLFTAGYTRAFGPDAVSGTVGDSAGRL